MPRTSARRIVHRMGLTWPNLDATPVTIPGYYWNEKWKKLARLGVGEKLPRVVDWEFIAHETEASSSEVARRLFDRYPQMTKNEFTYTTTTPLDRRLPIGEPPRSTRAAVGWTVATGAVLIGVGWWVRGRR